MAGGKNPTQRIETLEDKVANMSARLDVLDIQIKALTAVLEKGTDITEGHTSKLTVIEQILVLVDLKGVQAAIVAIEKENLGIRKDIEALQKWKDDLKKEKEEATRRWWSFGPNISAAIISGLIGLIILALNYWAEAPEHRGDLSNVICLCRMHDALFEGGYWSLEDGLGLLRKKSIASNTIRQLIDGMKSFRKPLDCSPGPRFVARHRQRAGFEV